MKKISKIIVALLCVLTLGLIVSGCSCTSNNSNSNQTDNKTAATTDNTTRNYSDSGKNKDVNNNSDTKGEGIVGSWRFDDQGASLVFTFNADKTGTYDIMGQKMDFTYNDDGSDLNIKFNGDTNVTSTPYTLNGDTLTIKDASGEALVYKRI